MNNRLPAQAPPRLCATCGMPPDALIHTGTHPARCHEFAPPRSVTAECLTCGWSCPCDTASQALEEAEEHERMDKRAHIDFQEVTR